MYINVVHVLPSYKSSTFASFNVVKTLTLTHTPNRTPVPTYESLIFLPTSQSLTSSSEESKTLVISVSEQPQSTADNAGNEADRINRKNEIDKTTKTFLLGYTDGCLTIISVVLICYMLYVFVLAENKSSEENLIDDTQQSLIPGGDDISIPPITVKNHLWKFIVYFSIGK